MNACVFGKQRDTNLHDVSGSGEMTLCFWGDKNSVVTTCGTNYVKQVKKSSPLWQLQFKS